MPSQRQIRYFLTVAELGSFTSAANILFVAQPALSRQIALLEETVGFLLFKREPRGVSLTPSGALLYERFSSLEKTIASAIEEGQQLDQGQSGVLRLLHSSSIPMDSLLPVIQQFTVEAARARIDLDRISSELQISEIAQGKADAGVIRLPVLRRDSDVRIIPLPPERLWVAVPENHQLAGNKTTTLQQLADFRFVSAVHRERGGLARRVTDLCLARGFVPQLAAVISRKTSMLALVAAGFGIAVIPEGMTRQKIPGLTCIQLTDEDADAASALVTARTPTPLAQRFIDLALDYWKPETK